MKTLLLGALLGLGSLQTAYMVGHPTVYAEKTECDICQVDAFKEGDEVIVLPCHPTHIFHSGCINEACKHKTKPTCPLCRAPVTANIESNPRTNAFIRFHQSALKSYSFKPSTSETVPSPSRLVKPDGITKELWDEASDDEKAFMMESAPMPERPAGVSKALWDTLSKEQKALKAKEKALPKARVSQKYIIPSEVGAGLLVGLLMGKELKKRALTPETLFLPLGFLGSEAVLNTINPERTTFSYWQWLGCLAGFVISHT